MLQIRNRILADPEIPVRMSRPLHIQRIPKIEWQSYALAFQFINYSTVINPLNRNPLAVFLIKQPPPLFANLRDTHCTNSEQPLGQQKIRPRLLLLRMDLHQHHIRRIMPRDNRVLQKPLVRSRVQPTQKVAKVRIESKHIDVSLR